MLIVSGPDAKNFCRAGCVRILKQSRKGAKTQAEGRGVGRQFSVGHPGETEGKYGLMMDLKFHSQIVGFNVFLVLELETN